MSYSPRPCSYCGGVNFHVLPEIKLRAEQYYGPGLMMATPFVWSFTMVVCAQCGHTDVFSTNTAEIVPQISGAYVATSGGR